MRAALSNSDDLARIEVRLPLPPSVNAMYTNVPGKGRRKTTRYKEWIETAGWQLKLQRPAKIFGKYDFSVLVPDAMVGDIDNRQKALLDLLVTHKVIPDDRHARSVSICRTPEVASGAHIIVHEVR